jgi:TPR repeat protein
MRRKACVLFAFSLLLSFPARADGLEGDVAFSSGDYAKALRIWRASAAAGDASAMLAVGMVYDTGHGMPQDFAAALSWYRQAAEAGNVHAMFNVAEMFDNGRGTPADRHEAIGWYGKAATRGYGRAAYNLGVIYRDGDVCLATLLPRSGISGSPRTTASRRRGPI